MRQVDVFVRVHGSVMHHGQHTVLPVGVVGAASAACRVHPQLEGGKGQPGVTLRVAHRLGLCCSGLATPLAGPCRQGRGGGRVAGTASRCVLQGLNHTQPQPLNTCAVHIRPANPQASQGRHAAQLLLCAIHTALSPGLHPRAGRMGTCTLLWSVCLAHSLQAHLGYAKAGLRGEDELIHICHELHSRPTPELGPGGKCVGRQCTPYQQLWLAPAP